MAESNQRPDSLTPLAPKQTEKVVDVLAKKGATFFDWEKFQKLTQSLPADTRITDLLKSLKKTK